MAKSTESVYRITELVGTSKKSWEDAARNAIETASQSLRDLRVAEVTKTDVVVNFLQTFDDLVKRGKVVSGTVVEFARAGNGVAVKAGAPKPDIGSVDALKKTLAAAKSVGISQGPSGVYLSQLFEKIGILAQLKPKLRIPPPGTNMGEVIAKGEAEIGFQQVSELIHYPGISFLGPIPAELQKVTVFSGAVHPQSREPDTALAFLRFLSAPEHAALLKKHGMELGSAAP